MVGLFGKMVRTETGCEIFLLGRTILKEPMKMGNGDAVILMPELESTAYEWVTGDLDKFHTSIRCCKFAMN